MEVLYYWTKKKGYIKKSGFNFSPIYYFDMEDLGGKYLLTVEKKNYLNIMCQKDQTSCHGIENVTALVGKNGSGKTTVLKCIKEFRCPQLKDFDYGLVLYVIKDDRGIIVETNLIDSMLEVKNKDIISEVISFDGKNEKAANEAKYAKGIYGFTALYMTNASYVSIPSVLSAHLGIESMTFSPDYLSLVASNFFEFIYKSPVGIRTTGVSFENYSIELRRSKTALNFQQFCDVLYFKFLKTIDNPIIKIPEFIGLNVCDIEHTIEYIKSLNLYGDKTIESYSKKLKLVKSLANGENNDLIIKLKICLIYEIKLFHKDFQDKIIKSLGSIDDVYGYIKNVYRKAPELKNQNPIVEQYFDNGISEIEKIQEIIEKHRTNGNHLVDYEDNILKIYDEARYELLDYIYKLIIYNAEQRTKKNSLGSFVLRYLDIANLTMSSGERALLNMMSWLHYAAIYNKISNNKTYYMKKNLFICIDEIDALCHPTWQREIIGYVISSIQNEYSDKNVQLVISTHSPLCLSNIPKQNILLLKNDLVAGIHTIDNNIDQTFGSNLYDILNNSFFLEDKTIGGYAVEYINNLLKEINLIKATKQRISMEQEKELLERINFVGDAFIKHKLIEVLMSSPSINKKRILQRQRELLDKEIERLEYAESNE